MEDFEKNMLVSLLDSLAAAGKRLALAKDRAETLERKYSYDLESYCIGDAAVGVADVMGRAWAEYHASEGGAE